MRSVHTDRFETVLPKTARFFTPKTKPPPPKTSTWGWLLAGALIGATLIGAMMPRQKESAPVTAAPPVVASTPPLVIPEVIRTEPAIRVESSTPRARLVHIRAIGTTENDRMPDGRILTTLYKGELPSAASLPTNGGQLGDMWYTRNDGHTWVLAPVTGGSQTIGWVDP